LHLTQGAISRQIRDLERFLGGAVFHRLVRRIELTPRGEEFLKVVETSLRDLERASLDFRPAATAATRLRVSVLPTIANVWLLPRLHLFSEAHPDIEVRIVSGIEAVDFQRGEADVAIRVGRLPGRHYDRRQPRISLDMVSTWEGVCADELFPDVLVPVCAPALVKNGAPLERPDDLVRYPLIHTASRKHAWPDWLGAFGVEAALLLNQESPAFGHFFMAIDAARLGRGISIVPEVLITGHEGEGLIRPLPQRIPSAGEYYLLTPESRLEEPSVVAFRNWLLSEVRRAFPPVDLPSARFSADMRSSGPMDSYAEPAMLN
jgi:LysR family glycine cleavage system transcriptional activator